MDASPLDKLRAFWNQRYAADQFAYGTEPNDFLVGVTPRFVAGGSVLCLADGEGRNGVWLACQGFAVTAIDIADRGLDKAVGLAARHGVALETRAADLGSCELGSEAWDAIVSVFLHLPRLPLFAAIFPIFCEPRARKRLIDMAWSSAESAKHVVVPTFPLA